MSSLQGRADLVITGNQENIGRTFYDVTIKDGRMTFTIGVDSFFSVDRALTALIRKGKVSLHIDVPADEDGIYASIKDEAVPEYFTKRQFVELARAGNLNFRRILDEHHPGEFNWGSTDES